MKSLRHNGIYIPPYDYKGLEIKIKGRTIKLSPKTEQMAIAFIRKEHFGTEALDTVFYINFYKDFLSELKLENPSMRFLESFIVKYTENVSKRDIDWLTNGKPEEFMEIDFSQVVEWLKNEKIKKETMSKEEKKRLAQERKAKREELKEKYGFAIIDGIKVELANWTAEPSCLFVGRGKHPLRGRWKEGPREEDIELNLSPDSPIPPGKWKGIVWEPENMWIARWKDKLTGKMKYVWCSPSAFLMQEREKAKFDKAQELGKHIDKLYDHICQNLDSTYEERRKVSTVCWLIYSLNMRVGDEKDPDEADTVGAITLRPEHVKISRNKIYFDFLGKDSVRWEKEIEAPSNVIKNIKYFSSTCKNYLFEGITSKDVADFLSEIVPKLTAKVFRTWRCTKTVKEYLESCKCTKDDPEYYKIYEAKRANLEAAKVCNHKKKLPANFQEKLVKKQMKVLELERAFEAGKINEKKRESLAAKFKKALLDFEFTKDSGEYNLNTSRNSYIDPRVYWEWMKKVELPPECIYSRAQLKKFSWVFLGEKNN